MLWNAQKTKYMRENNIRFTKYYDSSKRDKAIWKIYQIFDIDNEDKEDFNYNTLYKLIKIEPSTFWTIINYYKAIEMYLRDDPMFDQN